MAYGGLNKKMDAARKSRGTPRVSIRISLSVENRQARGAGRPNPSSSTKFSGANGGSGIFIFSVQPTTSKIGSLTRLIHTLL